MLGTLDRAFHFNEAALHLRAQRQQLLSANIANADTPNYKARDIDFKHALQAAMAPPQGRLASTHAAHLTAGTSPSDRIEGLTLLYRRPQQSSIDGNTVDMDVERNQFTDNAIRYEAGVTMLNAQIQDLMASIRG